MGRILGLAGDRQDHARPVADASAGHKEPRRSWWGEEMGANIPFSASPVVDATRRPVKAAYNAND